EAAAAGRCPSAGRRHDLRHRRRCLALPAQRPAPARDGRRVRRRQRGCRADRTGGPRHAGQGHVGRIRRPRCGGDSRSPGPGHDHGRARRAGRDEHAEVGAVGKAQIATAAGLEMRGKTMKSRVMKTVLCVTCALAPLAAVPAGPAVAQGSVISPAQDIALSIGRGQLVTVPGNMADVFVSNEAVADVQVKSQRQLYVFAKAGGETTVYASNAAGDIIWSANVRVGSNLDTVDQMLALAMPDAKISVATMGTNTVLLTGTVAAPEDAAEAERLVQAFMGDGTNVVSRLRMATPLQVNLRVRFAEASRSLVRSPGANLPTIDASSGFRFGIGRGRALAPNQTWSPQGPVAVGQGVSQVTAPLPGGAEVTGPAISPPQGLSSIAGMGRFLGLDILGALDAGETMGLVTTLSEPNLTALSGETAEFLAGGEFPIPLSQGLGTTSIEYKNYGVSLSYTPTVLANGRISIRVRPEVSELSTQGAVTLGDFTI